MFCRVFDDLVSKLYVHALVIPPHAQWLKMQYFVSLEGQSLSLVSIPGI